MNGCESYQAQFLNYLYDLLETGERQELLGHLEKCSACTAALGRAQAQQKLLAAAAKSEFPAVRFEAPGEEVRQPAVLPFQPARAQPRRWLNYAVAASVLALVGMGIPASVWTTHYIQEKQVAQRSDADYQLALAQANQLDAMRQLRLADAETALQLVDRKVQELPAKQQQKWESFQKQVRERQLDVIVTGPEALQPGARNEFQVRTQNLNGHVIEARLSARLRNEKNETVYEEKDVRCVGQYTLKLPPDLPIKPNSKLALEVAAHREGGEKSQVRADLTLAAPVYFTHLTTDKPMYQPGETVHFRSLTLNRSTLTPPDWDLHLTYTVNGPNKEELLRIDGSTVLIDDKTKAAVVGPDKKPIRGVGAGEYAIPAGIKGGEFTLTVSEASKRFSDQERKFIVNQYEKPRLNKELDFTRKSYGAGDQIVAACKVTRVEGGGLVARQPVSASLYVDGKSYGPDGKEGTTPFIGRTDDQGKVSVSYKLPAAIERGQASLSVIFTDNNIPETLVKPVPVVVKKLNLEFFPEGGYLVAGLKNRVYFQVRSMLGKPAEVKGRVIDQDGKVAAADVQTLHDDQQPGVNQGMGSFSFTPDAGAKYQLKIDSPSGIEGKYELPEVQKNGVVLSTARVRPGDKGPLTVTVASADKDRRLLVGAYCRGLLMDHQSVVARKGEETAVELRPEQSAGGVYRVTVFEELGEKDGRRQLSPVAERLVYRNPTRQLILTCKPNLKQYIPGEKVTVGVSALAETEKAAPAVLMVAVVDKSVVTMADEKTYRAMPTHFYLTSEVRRAEDLEYADFLVSAHEKAETALDLLLGTQGWRRFAEQDPNGFPKKFRDDADIKDAQRLLVMNSMAPAAPVNILQAGAEKLTSELASEWGTLAEERTRTAQAWTAAQDAGEVSKQREALRKEATEANAAHSAAVAQLEQLKALALRVGAIALPAAAVLLLMLAAVAFVVAVRRNLPQGVPYYASALVCSVLLVGVLALIPYERAEFAWIDSQRQASDMQWPEIVMAAKTEPSSRPATPLAATGLPAGPVNENFMLGAQRPMDNFHFGDDAAAKGGGGAMQLRFAAQGLNAPQGAVGGPNKPGEARMFNREAEGLEALRDKARFAVKLAEEGKDGKMDNRLHRLGGEDRKQVVLKKFELNRKDAEKEVDRQVRAGAVPDLRLRLEQADRLDEKAKKPVNEELQKRAGIAMGGRARGMGAGFGGFGGGGFGAGMGGMPGGGPMVGGLGWAQNVPPPPQPLLVREYAYQHSRGNPADLRSDFTETLFWHPVMVLPDGKGEFSFDLCDQVTSFQITAFGHSLDGRLGSTTALVESRLPLALEPKLPIEVTAGDKIDVAVTVSNNTNDTRPVQVNLAATGLKLANDKNELVSCSAGSKARRLYRVVPTIVEGQARLTIDGKSDPFTDTVTRTFQVVPDGFPIVGSHSDILEGAARQDIVLPENWIKGTLKCQLQVYPSTLADLQKGLEALLREPGGCFEQASSSNYPNVLILDYLKESDQAKPEIERRARDTLSRGYQLLTSYECLESSQNKRRGYEWFGGAAPPHEALTAYGLLEFRDMTRVFDVDQKMVERTRQYLLARKDGKGGFERNPRALDSFGQAPANITNAYIVWALTESSKDDDVEKELSALLTQSKTSSDPYFLALVANSLINRGKADDGVTILKTVTAAQKEDGHLDAASTSITGSGGRDLQIETTALAVLGWIKANRPTDFNMPVQKAIKWLGQQRGGYGGFGSTQSTILALKALIAFAKANKKTPEGGELSLRIGDAVVNQKFPAGAQEALVLSVPEPEKYFKPGKNTARVEITGKNVFPYTVTWSYQTVKPASADACPVKVSTRLDRDSAIEAETLHLTVTVENAEDKGQGMAVAIIGLPGGLTLPVDMKQLKDHARLRNDGKEKGLIDAWEIRGRELVLYWRDLAPKQKIEVPIDLVCQVPGEYRGPASRSYLYYNADRKYWVDPLAVIIKAKAD